MAAFKIAYSELTPLVEPEGNVYGGLNKQFIVSVNIFQGNQHANDLLSYFCI